MYLEFYKKISLFLIFFFPWPLFFDLGTGGVVLDKEIGLSQALIPVPLVFFLFVFLVLFNNLFFYKYKGSLFISLINNDLKYYFFVFSIFSFLWMILVGGVNLLKAIQIVIPLIILPFLVFLGGGFISGMAKTLIISSFIYVFFHNLYLMNNYNIFLLDRFEYIYNWGGYRIYSGLVSYPGVIGLYTILSLFLYYRERSFFWVIVSYIAYFSFIFNLLLAARRVSILEQFSVFLILLFFSSFYMVLNKKIYLPYMKRTIFIVLGFLFLFPFYLNSPMLSRNKDLSKEGDIDSGRSEIFGEAIANFSNSPFDFLVGVDGKSGYHNYILDLVFNIGLIPLLLFILGLVLVLFSRKSENHKEGGKLWIDQIMVYSILVVCFIQAMINSAITQPYYILNFFILMIVIKFYESGY